MRSILALSSLLFINSGGSTKPRKMTIGPRTGQTPETSNTTQTIVLSLPGNVHGSFVQDGKAATANVVEAVSSGLAKCPALVTSVTHKTLSTQGALV